jgi:hypothetical protein
MAKRARMESQGMDCDAMSLLQLPDNAIVEVLKNLDGISLVMLEQTARAFSKRDPVSRLSLTEHIAREQLERECGSIQCAAQLR